MNIMFFLTPKCDVVYVYDDFNVRQVLEKIRYHKYTAMPIIDRDGKYVGTITEGDLLWKLEEANAIDFVEAEEIPIRDINHRVNNKPVNAEARMEDLIELATAQNFVPVVDDHDVFVGIVTRKDIIRYLYDNYRMAEASGFFGDGWGRKIYSVQLSGRNIEDISEKPCGVCVPGR